MKTKLSSVGLAVVMSVLIGCGGGGGGGGSSAGSSTPPNNGSSGPVQGIATPSSVSVVTAQNAGAGG